MSPTASGLVLLSPPDLVAWLAERRLGLADLIED
jgi:hypothetical protein